MTIRIRKRSFGHRGWFLKRSYTIYVVSLNGRRIDSFLRKRNAERLAQKLASSAPPCSTGQERTL